MTKLQPWINFGRDGTFIADGKLSSTSADLDHLLGSALTDQSRLIIHFHGGLVTEETGLKTAEAMAANYQGVAGSLGIIWETGLAETFRDNLSKITQTPVFQKALSWVLAKVGVGDLVGARGAGGGALDARAIELMLASEEGAIALNKLLESQEQAMPPSLGRGARAAPSVEAVATDLEYDFASDPELPDLIGRGAPGSEPIRRNMDFDVGAKGSLAWTTAVFVARVVVAVVHRYRSATHHDALPTAVEELLRAAYLADVGKFAWDAMKVKAQRMWIDDGASPSVEGHGGGYLLRCLERLQVRRPDFIIDVVGHSAGSIAICQMLAAMDADKRRIKLRNVVFLAPAVRLDLFARWIVRKPQNFERFRMFTMTDTWEKADRLAGAIYPRSLLYMVSGCFEDRADDPLVGMARFLEGPTTTAGQDYDDVRRWLSEESRIVYAPSIDSAPVGLRTQSARHGDFDEEKETLASLLSLAR
jgi:hypothetical protein